MKLLSNLWAQKILDVGDDDDSLGDILSPASPEVLTTLALAPVISSTLSSSAISGQRAAPLFYSNSSVRLVARLSDNTVIAAKNQLYYLLSIELGSHTEEQRSLLLSALSTLIVANTPFQDAQTQVVEILPVNAKKVQSFAALSASVTAFTTRHRSMEQDLETHWLRVPLEEEAS
ncbi:hypothetical protein GH714_040522 [Hevea brasiliensis]|uniref:Uncharacterized protein n=1 Tax=Hevea brasiliensis TaxID=3981 RepID=A0A6A6MKC7_HEVBR|nr:hypothetical protein GH714_040522 [Hevea brasiliensis]